MGPGGTGSNLPISSSQQGHGVPGVSGQIPHHGPPPGTMGQHIGPGGHMSSGGYSQNLTGQGRSVISQGGQQLAGQSQSPDWYAAMGRSPAMGSAPQFDVNDFPTLSDTTGVLPQPHIRPPRQDFAMHTEDFPALSSASTGPNPTQASNSLHIHNPQSYDSLGSQLDPDYAKSQSVRTSSGSSGVGSIGGSIGNIVGNSASGRQIGPPGLDASSTTTSLPTSSSSQESSPSITPSATPSSTPGQSSVPQGTMGNSRWGLTGLLSVIKMTDPNLNTLALGTDLTTLGLNLNSTEVLYATFAYPCVDQPTRRESDYVLPYCYYMQPPALKTSHLSKFQLGTLFYIFYNMPKDTLQVYAAKELFNRDWRYHKEFQLWFTRDTATTPGATTANTNYIYWDINIWDRRPFPNTNIPGGLKFMTEDEHGFNI